MIRCKACGKLSNRNERTFLHVEETRVRPSDGGTEIVREVRICLDCHAQVQKELLEQKARAL
jgi:hypothetical protein